MCLLALVASQSIMDISHLSQLTVDVGRFKFLIKQVFIDSIRNRWCLGTDPDAMSQCCLLSCLLSAQTVVAHMWGSGAAIVFEL